MKARLAIPVFGLFLFCAVSACQRQAVPDEPLPAASYDETARAVGEEDERVPTDDEEDEAEVTETDDAPEEEAAEPPIAGERLADLERAAGHLRSGRAASALRIYESLVDDPDPRVRASARYNLGAAAFYAGQDAEARTHLRAAFTELPHFTPAGLALVRLALGEGGPAAGERALRDLGVESRSDDPRDHALRLYVEAHSASLEEVERGVQQWLPRDEENLTFYLALAVANLRRGRLELAEDICERALERRPGSVDFLFLLSQVQEAREEFQEATATLERAMREGANPLQPEVLNNLGRLYLKGLNWDLAAEVLERLVTTRPDHLAGWTNYATALKGQQRYDEALEAIRRAETIDPNEVGLQLNLGILYMEAEGLEGLDEMERLERARSYLFAYRDRARVASSHRVHRYIQEVDTAIELEQLMDEDLSDDDLDDLFDDDDLWGDDDWD